MKKYLSILLVLIATNTYSQEETIINLHSFDNQAIHYGYYLGGNRNTFKIAYKPNNFSDNPEVVVTPGYGFNLGMICDFRLHNNINIRVEPGVISNVKDIYFKHVKGEDYMRKRKVGNTYFHLPLIAKISTNRLLNFRPYILGGASVDYNFTANSSNINDNYSGEFRQERISFMYELGIGVDFYLKYFKFSPSIRALFSITNEIKYDNTSSPWTDPIYFMGTRGLFIHFAFE